MGYLGPFVLGIQFSLNKDCLETQAFGPTLWLTLGTFNFTVSSSITKKCKNYILQLCWYKDEFNLGWIRYYIFIISFSFSKSLKLKHFHGSLKVSWARGTVSTGPGDTLLSVGLSGEFSAGLSS